MNLVLRTTDIRNCAQRESQADCSAWLSHVFSYFKLISFEVTVLVNGLAVKRITAVSFVSGRFAAGRPPLELVEEPPDEELCEPAAAALPVWT